MRKAAVFCGDCAHCGDESTGGKVTRSCAMSPARRELHLEERGKTLDAYWTAPDSWVYVNSQLAERCKWFVAA